VRHSTTWTTSLWAAMSKIVAQNVCWIEQLGSKMGLVLKAKYELVTHPGFVVGDPLVGSFTRVEPSDATWFGAPLFPDKVLNDFWSDRCSALSRAAERLCLVSSQDALILLRASFSDPQGLTSTAIFFSRCAWASDIRHPVEISSVYSITNNTLSDSQWRQANLLIRFCGLGIKRVSSLTITRFLASAASTLVLQNEILGGSQP